MPNFIRIVFYENGAIGGQIYLSDRQKDIIDLIKRNPKIIRKKIAEILDINQSTVLKHLE